MKTPPMLVGAALLFWGWQAQFLPEAAVMAVLLEGSRFIKLRWELTNEDFSRIWIFCSLLIIASAAYAFTAGNGNSTGALFNPGLPTQNNVGPASARMMVLLIRWTPFIFFLFIAAQAFSSREGIPLEVISLLMQRRWKKLKKSGRPLPVSRSVNIAYPYFIACLFASSTHPPPQGSESFFIGICALIMWGLWPYRSRRFHLAIWVCVMGVVIGLGFGGQWGLLQLQRAIIQYNPQWLADLVEDGFDPLENRTEIGQIGRIKTSHRIVLRIETLNGSMPPSYLREAGYRNYRSGVWYSGSTKDDFVNVAETPLGSGNWPLFESKANPRTLKISAYLPGGKGLLPLPTDAARLEHLSAYVIQKNRVGAVHADGPGLVIFDALYGSGSGMDYPPDTNEDLLIAERERPALRQIVSELRLDEMDYEKKLDALSHFFATSFSYSLTQHAFRGMDTNTTDIGRFLLHTHSGHCEYFATSTVLLLRQLGIPARYNVGYAVHERSGKGYVIRQSDAHAWCRVWDDSRKRWENFDTTPGAWIAAERQQRSSFQFLSDWWSGAVYQFSKFRWGQGSFRQILPWLLAPVLAFLLFRILFRSGARRSPDKAKDKSKDTVWPGFDSEFYELEQALVKRGMTRRPSEPLTDWLRRTSSSSALAESKDSLDEILRLHYRYRFDPRSLDSEQRNRLRREVADCMVIIGKMPKS